MGLKNTMSEYAQTVHTEKKSKKKWNENNKVYSDLLIADRQI